MSEILENNELEEPTIIELEDDDGRKINFELLDYIEYEDDTEGYVSVDDDMVGKIYELFKERNSDKYDFDD